jgi:hypothetical protein
VNNISGNVFFAINIIHYIIKDLIVFGLLEEVILDVKKLVVEMRPIYQKILMEAELMENVIIVYLPRHVQFLS